MPDNNLITSNQVIRIADLAQVVAKNMTIDALGEIVLDSTTAQEKIIMKGGEFQALLSEGFASLIASAINKMAGRKHPQAEKIEEFFRVVLNHDIDLSGVVFPEKDGMPCYMADDPTGLTDDEIFSRGTAYFKKLGYSYNTPIASSINRDVEQKCPRGLYVFAHRGGDEPDVEHLGKSYDDATQFGMTFANRREYMLMSFFHHFTKGYFMDRKGYTRTSSLWSDGNLVRGCSHSDSSRLYLGYGHRGDCFPGCGPRELFRG